MYACAGSIVSLNRNVSFEYKTIFFSNNFYSLLYEFHER